MANLQWIKLCIDYLNDEKIQLIEMMPGGDALANVWIKLLCLAGKTNDQGLIYLTPEMHYTDQMLAIKFRKNEGTIRVALETFQKLKMIQINKDQTIFVTNWHKHQNVEGMEKIRELGRKRAARHRKYRKITDENNSVTLRNVTHNVTRNDEVTLRNDIDIELDKDKDIYTKESERKTESKSDETKHEYAPDVRLTEIEYRKLCEDYSETETKRMITELSNALGNTIPKNRYKSHYKTIRNWIERAKAKTQGNEPKRIAAPADKTCPECGMRYYGSACLNCGWGEQELRKGEGK